MPGLSDLLARGNAAGSMMRDAAPPSGGPEPEGDEPMGPPGGGPQDLDSALSGVDAALEGLNPKIAEECRTHLNAIRELASKDAPADEPAAKGAEGGDGADAGPMGDTSQPTGETLPLGGM